MADASDRVPNSSQFQSTHPCGCDKRKPDKTAPPFDFNPRTRVGCDVTTLTPTMAHAYFNPRTRVGCDFQQVRFDSQRSNFNPRTYARCDANASLYPQYTLLFQSTHPCGVRQGVIAPLVASLVLAQFQISHCCYRKSITGPHF